MNTKFAKLSLCSAIALASSSVFAVPVINSTDRTIINIPAGAETTDWYRSSNSSEIYISPPSEGESRLTDYAPRNKSFCTDLKIVRNAEQDALITHTILKDQLNVLAVQHGHYRYVLDANGRVVTDDDGRPVLMTDAEGNLVLTEFGAQMNSAIEERDTMVLEFDRLDRIVGERLRDVNDAKAVKDASRSELNDCRDEAEDFDEEWRDYCEDQYDEYKDARSDVRDAESDYSAARSDMLLAEYDRDRAEKALRRLEDESERARDRISSLKTTIASEERELKEMYGELANIYGGQINMTYRTQWGESVRAFSEVNPGKSIRRVNVYNPFLSLPVSGVISNASPGLSNTTGLLWSSLNISNVVVDKTYDELGNETGDKVGLAAWSDSFQGSIGVSLPNACEIIEGSEGLSGNALLAKYSSNFSEYLQPHVSYSFDVRASFGWEAEVNKSDILRVVEKVTKKKGFFSSKSKHSINREYDQLSSFRISFNSDARTAALSDTEKDDLTAVIRSRLTKDVLDQVARRVPVEEESPDLVEVADPGATELSRKLRSTCKYGWGYSCYGGWALYGLNAIFGNRTSQMSEYIQNNDFRARESVSDQFFIKVDRGIAFDNK